MAYVSKEKLALEKARGEYIANSLSIKEVAELNGLKSENFRLYLKKTNAIKPEHLNSKKAKIQNAVQAIEKVETATLPKATTAIFTDFADKVDKLKGDMLSVANKCVSALDKALSDIDYNNPDDLAMIKEYANALKALNEAVGIFPKAPQIAIQNNMQNNQYGAKSGTTDKKPAKLEVQVEFLGDISKKDDKTIDAELLNG
jgi:hypothetical protein|nr:MAG TPA_asm: hypothetical protein [Caudoviricetes sp.]